MIQNCSIGKVFNAFAESPKKAYQIRELSRKLKLATTSVKLHLGELEKLKLIKKQRVGVYEAYSANFEDENYRFYKRISNLIALKESKLVDYIENKTTPDAIVLFGSYKKGEDTEESDIDLLVIADETNLDLKRYESALKRKIQIFFVTGLKKLPKELKNNMLNGVVLSGFVRWT